MPTGGPRRRQRPEAPASGTYRVGPWWPHPPRDLELSYVWIDGEELALLSHPLDEPVPLAGLTEAERQVTADIVEGLTNEQIAHRRGTAPGTVAKQVASVFRKLGVGSRRQLVAMSKRTARGSGGRRH